MTIEGLGKKFQEARVARSLTLDEAARMTKIRPSRLAEIEADDFSQFPSLAYAKGFLLIYGKFLDVDVNPYMEAFETSDAVTVDGYSYLQGDPGEPEPMRTPQVRRRPERPRPTRPSPSAGEQRTSIMPLILAVGVIIIGFFGMRFILNVARLAPHKQAPSSAVASNVASPSPAASSPARVVVPPPAPAVSATPPPVTVAIQKPVASPSVTPAATPAPTTAPIVALSSPTVTPTTAATAAPPASEPEVRRAEPVRAEDLKAAAAAEAAGPNRIAIRPLKKTYIKVVIDDESVRPAFERWVSPSDGVMEFRGQKFAVRVLDRDAVQIKKNGKALDDEDDDVTVE
jgi:cytoskeletal protein RodZ